MFPQKTIQQVKQALTLLAYLREGGAPLPKTSKRDALSAEVKWFVDHALKIKALAPRKEAVSEWHRLHESTPCLTGRDIETLGYKPGPIFSRILDALRKARWEGKLRTREEEVRFIQASYPLHGC